MPTLKGVFRGQPTPPDHHRGHAGRRPGEDRRGAARRGVTAAAGRGARRRGGGRRAAGDGSAGDPRRALLRGDERDRARARRRRLGVSRVRGRVGGLCAPLRETHREGPFTGRARDAGDRRLSRAAEPPRDRADPRRQRRRRRRGPRRARPDRRERPRERVRRDPLSHHAALRTHLRARVARRTPARRRPRRGRDRDPRAPRSSRREAPGANSRTWFACGESDSVSARSDSAQRNQIREFRAAATFPPWT